MKKITTFLLLFISMMTLMSGVARVSPVEAVHQGTFHSDHDSAANCNQNPNSLPACTSINVDELGFKIPSLGDILTFAIRAFFVIAGIAALFYMLIGAFAWVTSGGDKDAVGAAREKIQAAVIGMILIVAVLAIIWTLEQVIFRRRICLGLSCPLTLPGLIEPGGDAYCCACVVGVANGTYKEGQLRDVVNTSQASCNELGKGVRY